MGRITLTTDTSYIYLSERGSPCVYQLMREYLLLRLDELAGQARHKVFAPLLWDFCVLLSKLVSRCSHAGGLQALAAWGALCCMNCT